MATAVQLATLDVPCPIIDQRNERTNDGQKPEDGSKDCVPASLMSMARGLAADKMQVGGQPMSADYAKDAVYGQGWTGLQDPAKYVAFFARYGLKLTAHSGTAKDRYYYAAAAIQQGVPVLFSIPSDWNDTPPTSSFCHMVAACSSTDRLGTHVTAMNPWTATYQTETRDWWIERLDRCAYKLIWLMERTTQSVAWHQQSDKTGRDDAGHTCGEGMLNYLQRPEHADLLASDGLMSETYVSGNSAFLPLASGAVVRGSKTANGWTFDTNGAAVLAEVWQLYQALKNAPAAGTDPIAAKALEWVAAGKALFGEL